MARDEPCLTLHQQQQLLSPVTEQEIHQIVQKLPQDKTPGIDGYPAEFFKEFWPIVGGGGKLPRQYNSSSTQENC